MPVSINTRGEVTTTVNTGSWFSRMYDGLVPIPRLSDQSLSRIQKKKAQRSVVYLNPWLESTTRHVIEMPAKPKKRRHMASWYALYRSKETAIRSKTNAVRSSALSFFN